MEPCIQACSVVYTYQVWVNPHILIRLVTFSPGHVGQAESMFVILSNIAVAHYYLVIVLLEILYPLGLSQWVSRLSRPMLVARLQPWYIYIYK